MRRHLMVAIARTYRQSEQQHRDAGSGTGHATADGAWRENGVMDSSIPDIQDRVSDGIARLSEWIDAGNAHRDPEAATWARIAKITEEAGEVVAAHIGATGQNPRKGTTHTPEDVQEELIDVAVTALAALEHLRGHDRRSIALLEDKLVRTLRRAGLED
ncbi:MazG-like family protein [Brachybacterium sp. DNPG3]